MSRVMSCPVCNRTLYGLIFCWANGIFPKYPCYLPSHTLFYNVILTFFQLKGEIYTPPWNLGGPVSALRVKVMLGDFQRWVIKYGALSIFFARTLELEVLSHCVRSLTIVVTTML